MALGDGLVLALLRVCGADTMPLRPGEPMQASLASTDNFRDMLGGEQYGSRNNGMLPYLPRSELLKLLQEMDRNGIVSSLLDMHSDDACAVDQDTKQAITVEGPARLTNVVWSLFNQLDIERKLPSKTRQMCKYGNCFERLGWSAENGVTHAIPTNPFEMEVVTDPITQQLKGFKQRGRKFRNKENDVSYPWDYLDWRMLGKDDIDPYGVGVIEPGLRPWSQLWIAEDFALMYRVQRQPDRLAFEIDVGTSSQSEGMEMVQEFRRRTRRSAIVDSVRSLLSQEYRNVSPLDDLYLGKRPGSETKVTPLPGSSNVQDVTDLNYFTKQFLLACNTPPALFGYQDTSVTTEPVNRQKKITNQDVRYANHIRRIQKSVCTALYRLVQIHLAILQQSTQSNSYDFLDATNRPLIKIGMRAPSFLEELERIEVMQLRNAIASEMLTMGVTSGGILRPYEWTNYILREVLLLPAETCDNLTQQVSTLGPEDVPDVASRGPTSSKKTQRSKRKSTAEHARALGIDGKLLMDQRSPSRRSIELLNEVVSRSPKIREEIERVRLLMS